MYDHQVEEKAGSTALFNRVYFYDWIATWIYETEKLRVRIQKESKPT